MKKYIVGFLLILLMASAAFAGGIFLAERRMTNTTQKSVNNPISQEEVKNTSENNNVGIVGVNPEENKTEEPSQSSPKEKTKFSFAILGDTQYFKSETNGGYQKAVASIKKMNPKLLFAVGDMVSSCDSTLECEEKYNSWKSVLGSFASKAYVMQGNHDRTGKEKADSAWEKSFSYLPGNGPEGFVKFAYSFDYENSHFVVLDSDKPKEFMINETQRNWLDSDLGKFAKENTFVFFHEPAYPTNSKIDEGLDTNPKDRDALWNILTSHKVTAVFSGHEHIQSRRKVNGLYQFVFGNTDSFNHLPPKSGTAEYSYVGQGFGMVEVNGKEITVKTYEVGGKLLDSFALAK